VKIKSKKQVRKSSYKFKNYRAIIFTVGLILIIIGLAFDFNKLFTALFIGIGGLLILFSDIRSVIYGED